MKSDVAVILCPDSTRSSLLQCPSQYSHRLFRLVFDLPVHHLLLPRFRSRQLLYYHLLCLLHFLPLSGLPGTGAAPMPEHEPVLSFPSLASLDALAGHFVDGSIHRMRTPPYPYASSLLRSGDATAEGSPGVAFDSTALTGAVFPPHAEPPLIIDHDGEGW